MRRVFTYTWPTGTGKTAGVLGSIFERGRISPGRLSGILFVAPSARAMRSWTRELLLMLAQSQRSKLWKIHGKIYRGKEDDEVYEKAVRNASFNTQRKWLALLGFHLHFCSHRQFGKMRNRGKRSIDTVVIDEWHRTSGRMRDKAFDLFQYAPSKDFRHKSKILRRDGPVRHWAFDLGQKRKLTTYLVSATPVNSVEERDGDHGHGITNEQYQLSIEQKKFEMLIVAKAFSSCNILIQRKNATWPGLKSSPKIYEPPLASRFNRDDALKAIEESEEYKNVLRRSELSFPIEYSYCTLIHPTSYDRSKGIWKTSKGGKGSHCGGYSYDSIFKFDRSGNWNKRGFVPNHIRMKLLIETLKDLKVLKIDDETGELRIENKCLIFCTHRGVARIVYSYLRAAVKCQNHFSIYNTLSKKKECRGRGKSIDCRFRLKGGSQGEGWSSNVEPIEILIATDVYSESVDLHDNCQQLIHFELPWSPIRLMQRVGRLTRRLGDGFNRPTISHIIVPGSVEEERTNRLVRRFKHLSDENLLPIRNWKSFARKMIGGGPSLQAFEMLNDQKSSDLKIGS